MPLTPEEYEQYSRQLILPGFGVDAQEKLKQAKILVVGAGGLGCPVMLYLAAAGIGTIGIVDDDVVSLSNLHRQVLYGPEDIGKPKVAVAQAKLGQQDPNIQIKIHQQKITSQNALEIIGGYDIVVDGTDNFPSKYLLNDACVISGKIFVYGSILRFEGQVAVFNHRSKINYRDLFPEPPQHIPNCAEAGVLGSLCGIIGSIQANEVIKILTGLGESLDGKLLLFNSMDNTTQVFKLKKDTGSTEIINLIDYDLFCNAQHDGIKTISPAELREMLSEDPDIQLIDVREPWEKELHDEWGGTLIPLDELEKNISRISKEKRVVLYCKTGTRSRHAARKLMAMGFTNLINLED
jgi:sulfur-carrier protein adenylyltransferase/sulfurtransferase